MKTVGRNGRALQDRPRLKQAVLPLCATTCALLWGSAFPVIKYAYRFIDATSLENRLAFAGIRFTLAGTALLIFVPRILGHFRNAPKGSLFAVTLFQTVLQYFCFYWGLAMISGVLSAILIATGSFWWVILAPLFNRNDKVTPFQLLLLFLGFIGVCICVYRPGAESASLLPGSLLMLGASISGVVASLTVRPLGQTVPTTFVTGFALCLGGLLLMAFSPEAVARIVREAPPVLMVITFYLAFLSAVAFSLWYYLVTVYDIPTLSGYRFLIPLCGVLESTLFIPGERIGFEIITGGALVLTALWLLEKARRTSKR